MHEVREAIKQHVLDEGESYKTIKSDKHRFVIGCKDSDCKFRIRASQSKKEVVSITVFEPHSCSPATHYKSWQSQSIKYLTGHHRASVIDNHNITARQIMSNERLQYSNNISYQQAYRTISALLTEIDGDEVECFAKFHSFFKRYEEADPDNYACFEMSESGNFEAVFMAPAGTRNAFKFLRSLVGLDGAITKSRFRMQLLIACGINANDEVLPVAWGLVPIENTECVIAGEPEDSWRAGGQQEGLQYDGEAA
jgi:tryptophan 2,3-dioxygenase